MKTFIISILCGLLFFWSLPNLFGAEDDLIFLIGSPDRSCSEFALANDGGYPAYPQRFPKGKIEYIIGKSVPENDWPFVHPAPLDQQWAKGGQLHPFTIRFESERDIEKPTAFVIGYVATLDGKRSEVTVSVNGKPLPVQIPNPVGGDHIVHQPSTEGAAGNMIFEIPAGNIKKGENSIEIVLDKQSWILYDYIALRTEPKPLEITRRPEPNLLENFRNEGGGMQGVEEIVFAIRNIGVDGHWYANFGYYADDDKRLPHFEGGKLCVYEIDSGKVRTLVDDPKGSVRDPQVHYDAEKILFSYRPGGTRYFHLYEIGVDGKNLRQLTEGDFDDIEPTYLASGDIMFVSTRCKRWVQCWLTQVATLHRCNSEGKNIREISSNVEQDNTPWPLPNGQLIYTRWEYVDRSQVHFHHLWTTAPDGTRQNVYFGNMHPGTTMIDAKPIPGSGKIVASFSPGHGREEHAGMITVLNPLGGPDDRNQVRNIGRHHDHRDPWAFSETEFMAALDTRIMLIDKTGREQTLFQLPDEWRTGRMAVHEPRPIMKRERETVVADLTAPEKETGQLSLINIYEGRNMAGIEPGSIKKLLVLETLPKPINFTGGMEPMTYGGSFTLERILGTVPVEEDGSAFFELPAMRSVFFVALDENDRAVKRMQSFVSVMPGESTSCIGCHEHRTLAPSISDMQAKAVSLSPKKVVQIEGFPDVIDYPRDIQPIWNKHCSECHSNEKRDGGLNLSGDRTPLYSISYYSITARDLVADGRNMAVSNYPPYALGTGSSRLLEFLEKEHYEVDLADLEKKMVRLWIDTGATYLGTYAGLGSGMIGGYAQNNLDRRDLQWPEMQASMEVLKNKCTNCHTNEKQLALSPSHEIVNPPWEPLQKVDARRKFSRQLLYNLTNPEKSLLLLAPLSKEAGGFELCGKPVFESKNESDYKTVLAAIERTKDRLDEIKRFDMPGFVPREQYIREMKKYGILPPEHNPADKVDYYELDRQYWKSLWYVPKGE